MKTEIQIAQMTANIQTVLRSYNLPPVQVLTTQVDRFTGLVRGEFIGQLDTLVLSGAFRQWDFVKNHGTTAVRGWRENVHRCSVQVIEHKASGTQHPNLVLIECDVDLYNPDFGAWPALQHTFFEVWKPGKTDAFSVRAGLLKRGIHVPEIEA